MRNAWLVKNYGHVFRRCAPTDSDSNFVIPSVWVDIVNNLAYVISKNTAGITKWASKAPDIIINTPTNNIYVVNTIDVTPETVTFQGEQVTISGEDATW